MQVCPPTQGPLARCGAHFILRWRSCRCGARRPCLQVAPSSRYWRKSRPRRAKRAEAKALTGERRPRAAWRIALCRARTRPPRSQAAWRSKPQSIYGAVAFGACQLSRRTLIGACSTRCAMYGH